MPGPYDYTTPTHTPSVGDDNYPNVVTALTTALSADLSAEAARIDSLETAVGGDVDNPNMVTAAAVMTATAIVKGSGARGVEESGILIDASDNITNVAAITATGAITAGAAGIKIGATTVDATELGILENALVTTDELNVLQGSDAGTTITLDGTEAVVIGDSGVTKKCLVSDISAYAALGAGTGTVTGPPTSTPNAIARFNGAGGTTLKDTSAVTIDDTGIITAAGASISVGGTSVTSTELGILDGATVTTDELNVLDGTTTPATATLVGTDGVVVNDKDDVIKQALMSDIYDYIKAELGLSKITVGNPLIMDPYTTSTTFAPFAHGLGAIPSYSKLHLECKIAERGWIEGDVIDLSLHFTGSSTNRGFMVGFDSTNIYLGTNLYAPNVQHKTATTLSTITTTRWKLIITPYLFS